MDTDGGWSDIKRKDNSLLFVATLLIYQFLGRVVPSDDYPRVRFALGPYFLRVARTVSAVAVAHMKEGVECMRIYNIYFAGGKTRTTETGEIVSSRRIASPCFSRPPAQRGPVFAFFVNASAPFFHTGGTP